MQELSIELLGGCFIHTPDAEPIRLDQGRLEELVTYLALRAEYPLTRQQIAFQFWPDTAEAQALTNLRNILHKLQKAWPGAKTALQITRATIGWRSSVRLLVDAREFDHQLDSAEAALQSTALAKAETALSGALALYRGDLLPHSYEEWIIAEREQLRSRYLHALQQWATLLYDQRRYEEAVLQAETLLQFDPLRESSYRLLMELHAALNDRAAALRLYHLCASTLERELGVEPSAATKNIYDRLLNLGELAQPQIVAAQNRIPLVGRRREWQQLLDGWRQVKQGRARWLLIQGEAGIGKTRLAEELLDLVAHRGIAAVSARSYAAAGAPAYAPLSDWLRQAPLSNVLERLPDLWRVELAHLCPELLAERPDLPVPGSLRESWQQQRFYEAIAQALLAAPQPLVLHLDDLQWCDDETLSALGFLLHRLKNSPFLVISSVRSEEMIANHPLCSLMAHLQLSDQLRTIELGPLDAEETAELATRTAGVALSATELAHLYHTTEGHPLFLIETVRAGSALSVSEPWTRIPPTANSSSIPPKILAVIQTRLGQISPAAQALAQVAAVIGRNFTFSLLRAASDEPEQTLVTALDELWRRRIVREQGVDAYDFSHDRLREVAYAEISQARRRLLHRRVAAGLAKLYAADLNGVAGRLATHYAEAGERPQAVHFFEVAGHVAMQQNALREAEHLYRRALDWVDEQDLQTQLHLLLTLDDVLAFRAKDDARTQNTNLILALAERLPPDASALHARVLLCRSSMHRNRGQYHEAFRMAQLGTEQAHLCSPPAILARAYYLQGLSQWSLTQMRTARTLFQQSAAYARTANELDLEAQALEFTAATGMFSGMPATEMMALMTKSLELARTQNHRIRETSLCNKFGYVIVEQGNGELDIAEQHYQHGLRLTEETGDRALAGNIWSNLIVLYTHRGDYLRAEEATQQSLAISAQTGFHIRLAADLNYRGKALLQQGKLAAAQCDLQESIRMSHESNSHHFQVKTRSDLGLLYHIQGDHCAAQSLLEETLQMVQGHGDTRFEAHACTRLGYALEAQQQVAAAEAHYHTALALHQQMEQHNYALNAAAGLARIARQRGQATEAVAQAQKICQQLDEATLNATIETMRIYRTCYEILVECDPTLAIRIANMAQRQLDRRAATIADPTQHGLFWQIPDHQFFTTICN